MQNFKAYEQRMDSGAAQVVLEGAGAQLMIAPKSGFKLYSAIFENKQMLMPTQLPLEGSASSGVPILFPFPNRTRDCKYTYKGVTHEVKKNGEPRYLHGMMIDEEFSYNYGVTSDSAWCSGVASITPAKEYFDSFPFPCTLKLTYTLSAEGLRLDYKVTNDGEETLPYGFAIHPYFDKMGDPDSITITVPADQLYEAFEMLPTGNLLPVEGDFDLRPAAKEKKKGLFAKEEEGLTFSEHKVSQAFIDHVYTGLDSSKQALIHYEKLGLTLALRASDEFKNMVVYTPANRPGFCLENQTNATDFINLHEQGIETANMLELPAGQTRGGYIELTIIKD